MKGYTKRISNYFKTMPENMLIEASDVREKQFPDIPETAYYKAIERFTENGELIRLTKGVYYKPKRSRFGIVPISDLEIAEYYTNDNRGIIIGTRLYNEKGITTQLGKKVEVLTNRLKGDIRNANNVTIRRSDVELNADTIPIIEAMEILQNYKKIEDADNRRLIAYMRGFVSSYSDEVMNGVLKKRKYKKSTIAFLRNFLDHFGIDNTLSKYLSKLSVYAVPTVEEINETA